MTADEWAWKPAGPSSSFKAIHPVALIAVDARPGSVRSRDLDFILANDRVDLYSAGTFILDSNPDSGHYTGPKKGSVFVPVTSLPLNLLTYCLKLISPQYFEFLF